MSRIGKRPIALPAGVKVQVFPDHLDIEGPKGKLQTPLHPGLTAGVEGPHLTITRADDSKPQKMIHGLCRALAANAVVGVSTGFQKQLEIVGVGYKARVDRDNLELSLGYSRPKLYPIPKDVEIVCEKPTLITVRGIDRQRVGQVADDIKRFRKPDPYKQKGVRYVGERLIKKERKAGVTSA
ncbi:MAG: 50S ribosomal protein L6 [Candidatus Aminicenantes bacterium]|nr:50S ribosomal protein L6 [Candidatus Aminicenantes bacterium]